MCFHALGYQISGDCLKRAAAQALNGVWNCFLCLGEDAHICAFIYVAPWPGDASRASETFNN